MPSRDPLHVVHPSFPQGVPPCAPPFCSRPPLSLAIPATPHGDGRRLSRNYYLESNDLSLKLTFTLDQATPTM
ncbi:hypothetical protein BO443_80093 [Burkholderia orbicola]